MADIELLPLVGTLAFFLPEHHREVVQSYARANVEHHAEKLRTEIEALRVRADAMAGEAVKHEARAERLEDALRHMVSEAIDGGHNYMLKAIKDSGASALLRDQEAPQ